MKREEEIKKAAKQRADQYSHSLQWNDVYNAFVCGANWADKHINVNFVFLTGFEAAQKPIVLKLQSLIEEWSHNDSSEGKYRLEAYKELLEFIEQ